MALDLGAIEAQLNEAFPGAVVDRDGEWLVLDADQLPAVAAHLRDEMGFDWLTNLSGSDYPDRLEVVYNVHSTRPDQWGPGLPFKVRVPDQGRSARAEHDVHLARRQFPGARGVGHVWRQVRRPPRPEAHPAVGGVRGLSHAQGLARALLRGGPEAVRQPLAQSRSAQATQRRAAGPLAVQRPVSQEL